MTIRRCINCGDYAAAGSVQCSACESGDKTPTWEEQQFARRCER